MLTDLKNQATSFVSNNATTLLTAGGVVGTVATAVLTGRASIKAYQLLEAEQEELERLTAAMPKVDGAPEPQLSFKHKAIIVAPHFVPPVVMGALTVGSIVMANRVSAQQAAALAAAYGIAGKQRDEYIAKLQEKLSPKKADEATGEIQQDRIDRHPPGQTIVVGTGPVLCYDAFSDRYFKTTADHIRRAERVVNGEIETGGYCKLGMFYHELELPQTMFDDMLGWNIHNQCKVVISAMMMNDDACLCLEFLNLPVPDFGMDYS